ncbi:MAG: response regulator, partial [Planctomycetota bacterium]
FFAEQDRDLKYLSLDRDVVGSTPAVPEKLQAFLVVHRPDLINVGLIDATGQVVSQAAKDRKKPEFSKMPEFVAARETGRGQFGLCVCAEGKGQPGMAWVFVPVLSEGKFGGAVFACMDMAAVWKKCLSRSRDAGPGVLWAVNAEGRILHHPNRSYVGRTWAEIEQDARDAQGAAGGRKETAFAALCRSVQRGEEGTCRVRMVTNGCEPELVAFTPLRVAGRQWGLAAASPGSVLSDPIASHARLTYALMAALTIVFASAGYLFGRGGRARAAPDVPGLDPAERQRPANERGLTHGAGPAGDDAATMDHAALIERLRAARQAAESANQAKSDFLANMSHEIRTPLTTILGFADLLAEPEPDPSQSREWLAAIRRNGDHLLTLINGILDLSKIEAGKLALQPARCSIVAVVADVAEMMRARALTANLLLSVQYAGELPETILADQAALRQVLVNLIGNAIKFTERGSVTVTVSFLPDWRDGRAGVRLQVADTGVGIAPDQLSRLDEAFFQVDGSGSWRHDGTGLGLTIAHRLVEMHGGELSVHSALGEGSVFAFVLPTGPLAGVPMLPGASQGPADAPAHAADDAVGPLPLAGLRVLLAEDGQDNRRLISALLRAAGAHVQSAENGRAAVQMASEHPFDVILMDIQMPEMDGCEAARLLRRQGRMLPIIALTAYAMAGDRDTCLAAGCSDYLTKPIDRKVLVKTLRRYAAAPPPPPSEGPPADIAAELPDRIRAMREALAHSHLRELARLAGRLQTDASAAGLAALTAAAHVLQSAASATDTEAARLALHHLAELCGPVVAARRRAHGPAGQA